MRFLLSIYILILTNFCFGQNLNLVETKTEMFYKILKDSINFKLNYPNGRYKIYLTDTNKLPINVFYVKEGKVDGSYLELKRNSWTYGNYHKDSLWTFLTNPEDSTFKIGTWKTTVAQYSSYSGKYNNYYTHRNEFKIPFNNSDKFTEIWHFHNGHIAREAIFKKGFGLEKETYWDFSTNKVSKKTVNSGTENYYQTITYKNDSILYVSIIQNGIECNLNFNYNVNLSNTFFDVEVYSDNWERPDLPITTLTIDSSRTLTRFNDLKRKFFIQENADGNISLRYLKKSGKWKHKTLKIK